MIGYSRTRTPVALWIALAIAAAAPQMPSSPGLAYSLEAHVAPHLASGALVRVLEDWSPPFPGYFMYYPSRRQQPAALTALIDTLRL